jgi:hypothetical protein
MTRGEFADIRRRMRGMDGDIRGLAQTSDLAAERAHRLSQSIRGVSGRLGQMQRTGALAGHEMDYMRRSMGLLSRDLRLAARSGELTEEEFHNLRDELDETRLAFDRLDNETRRHSAVAQRRAREAAAAQREEMRQQMAHGQQIVAHQRRISRAHAAALREDAARTRRAEAQRQAAMRRAEAEQRAHLNRLASMSEGDRDLNLRFQGLSDEDIARITRSMGALNRQISGLSGGSVSAQRNIRSLGQDMDVMSRILGNAARDGRLSRREFTALANGMDMASRSARALHQSGDLTSDSFRNMRREIGLMRAQLNLLGDEGSVFDQLDARLLLFHRHLQDTNRHGSLLRRTFGQMGSGLTSGLRGALTGVGSLVGALGRMGSAINFNRRWTAILVATLLLIGPAAQALGSLLVTVLGGAFIALGAFALRGSSRVQSAFKEMKATLDTVLTESAAPMEGALVDGLQQVATTARRIQPALTSAFQSAAPLVSDFIGGITNLIEYALPGFEKALRESGPVMEGFRSAMAMVGSGIGDMFASMTEDGGAQGLKEVWETLGAELRNLLVNIGQFTNFASQSSTATALLVGSLRALSGILHIVEGGLSAVDALFGPLLDTITGSIGGVGTFSERIDGLGGVFKNTAGDVDVLKNKLSEVDRRIAEMKAARDSALAKGPNGADFLAGIGATDEDLNAALQEREDLVGAIADAESRAATETGKHAASVKELIGQIQALTELNRNYLDAQTAQEQAIADATKKQNKWGEALTWSNGQLERNGQAGRDAYEMLSQIARTTQEATSKAEEANAPWEQINQRWKDGRQSLIELADGWGLNKEQAKQLADQILGIPPSKDVFVKAETAEAVTSLDAVIAAMEATPHEETITVQALAAEAQTILEDLGYTVTRLPDGTVKITAEAGAASAGIGAVQAARDKLSGKKISIGAGVGGAIGPLAAVQAARDRLKNKSITVGAATGAFRSAVAAINGDVVGTAYINVQQRFLPGPADNRVARPFGASGGKASSLPMKRFATGGSISGGVLDGPGTKTSDSIVARLSRGEFVMRAAAVDKYGADAMQRINLGLLPKFASGGSAARNARNKIEAETTVSRFGKMAGRKNSEFISAMTNSDTLGEIVSALAEMRSNIQKGTSGRTERRLLTQLDAVGSRMLRHQRNLSAVNKSLEKAKDKLDELKDAASQLKESVKSGIINELNITRSASREDSQVTLNTVMSQLTADSSRAKQFQSLLATLKTRGVSGRVLEQVAQAGVDGGGLETATALMSASSSQIKRINEMQQSIRQSADDAGDVAASALYGAGIKAAEGLVKGLQGRQNAIEKQMMAIAKSMEKAIKKALGIKSPSRVMQQVGHFTAEGFALGIEKNNRPKHSWESLLSVPSTTSGGAGHTAGRGSEPMIIQLNIGGKNIGEVIIDPLRKSIRHRGGDVQAVLGK